MFRTVTKLLFKDVRPNEKENNFSVKSKAYTGPGFLFNSSFLNGINCRSRWFLGRRMAPRSRPAGIISPNSFMGIFNYGWSPYCNGVGLIYSSAYRCRKT